MTRTLSRPRIRARSNRLLLALLILAVAYVALDFLPIPANRVELYPLHRDDYANLARSIETLESHPPRPVSTFAITLLATAGPRAYYVALNALTIVYPALVFVFLGRLFGRSLSPVAMGIAAVLLFSFANSVEWAKYTGLMTNLLSGVFGVLALLCIYDGLAVQARNSILGAGVVFYGMSVFSKEDFALPGLILIMSHLARSDRRIRRGACALGAVAACLLALLLYNSRSLFSFTRLAGSGPYQARFSPISVASTFFRYLTLTPFLAGVLIVLILAATATGIAARESRGPILLTLLMIGSLIVPYAVLPSHLAFYYPYGWLVWETGLIGICLTILADRIPRPGLLYLGSALLTLFAAWRTHPERKAIVEWYRRESDRNAQIVRTLIENREALSHLAQVGIVGIDGLSPWSHSSGEYLWTRLQLRNHWIVFVPASNMFYSLDEPESVSPNWLVHVRPLSEISGWSNLSLLIFDDAGRGRLVGQPTSAPN